MECGSARCSGTFGFWLYHVPPRVEDDLRREAKEEQERRAKQREASAARVARAARKAGGGVTDAARQRQAEQLFCASLVDACPRCGFEPPRSATREELEEHVQACTDKRKHAAHKAAVQAAEAKKGRKEEKEEAQAEAQNLATWQFLGGDDSQAWLLTDTQVKKQCEERGLSTEGSNEERLARMAGQTNERKLLTDGQAGSGGAGSSRASGISAASLPANLHGMSVRQLKAVCAAHGIVAEGSTSGDLIHQLESAVYSKDEPMLLEDKPSKARKPQGKSKYKEDSSSDDERYEDGNNDDDD